MKPSLIKITMLEHIFSIFHNVTQRSKNTFEIAEYCFICGNLLCTLYYTVTDLSKEILI